MARPRPASVTVAGRTGATLQETVKLVTETGGTAARTASSTSTSWPSHPLGRIAEPEEVADAIVWLATNKSSCVTGVALPVDGGYLAR